MDSRARRILRTAIASILLMLMCTQALAASIPCYINSDTKVYLKPSTSSASLRVPEDMEVTLAAYDGSWGLVYNGDIPAYIKLKYLTFTERMTAYTIKDAAMYAKASTSSTKYGTLGEGTTVYIIGLDGNYFRVQNKPGSITGYIAAKAVSFVKPEPKPEQQPEVVVPSAPADSPNGQKIATVIAVSQAMYGRPYEVDANPPYSFDCSRFVRYCYQQVGIKLPNNAKKQGYTTDYPHIANPSDLAVGDVVCFNTNETDEDLSDHTGIYIGDGHFVHASSAAGKVIVSDLSRGYYARVFSWGLRILQ